MKNVGIFMYVRTLSLDVKNLDAEFQMSLNIRKTCPCNEYPLKPHFYLVKLGFAGVYLFFLFLLQNIDCGYTLEPPRLAEAVLTCTHNLCFGAKIRKISKFF